MAQATKDTAAAEAVAAPAETAQAVPQEVPANGNTTKAKRKPARRLPSMARSERFRGPDPAEGPDTVRGKVTLGYLRDVVSSMGRSADDASVVTFEEGYTDVNPPVA